MLNTSFGRLTVTSKADKPRHWVCLCACGNTSIVRADHLRAGITSSCGCAASEQIILRNIASAKHRLCDTRTYKSWQSMRTRCLNKRSDQYPDYGARGITVCSRWESFEAFLEDMGERPDGHSIDRIDNDKGYEKSNCRWATMRDQENNKRNNVLLEFKGRNMTIAEWSRETGIRYHTIMQRHNLNWPVERILTESVSKIRRKSPPKG